MTQYRLQEADLDIPDSWHDQSINIFKLPATNGAREASFVISRDPSQGDVPFADYVTRQLESAEKQLPGFRLVKRWDIVLHGHAATLLDYTWRREGQDLMLRQVFVERKPAVLITTLTTTPEDLVHHEPAWKMVMQTLKPLPSVA
ncbi:DcrB-related protein [Phytopseudomonas dryadis]|uniref:DUF1795 domain-containing protein n=1 Tax=Phytopseudomonas dryadis TaxID=2487520 RepID=A0A4Q9R1V5_9GAMM|nr:MULTISPECIES: DcrB-related protein [Pseudomonas]TBU92770.1 hypothetical protein DNK44_11930 [Pseudomonas dryadis]TBV03262.1 hypothetical protein DNK34_16880 [Pseudomonas dryadis]TBV16364.1 hypothetical protein DNK41_15885 [Pseudomonas sp. FRB 230]